MSTPTYRVIIEVVPTMVAGDISVMVALSFFSCSSVRSGLLPFVSSTGLIRTLIFCRSSSKWRKHQQL